MKDFDLSDKELKDLFQSEGLDAPSMGFNKKVLSSIEAYQKRKVKPVKAPRWLLAAIAILLIIPVITLLVTGEAATGSLMEKLNLSSFSTGITLSSASFWFALLMVGVIFMAILFDKMFFQSPRTHNTVKKG